MKKKSTYQHYRQNQLVLPHCSITLQQTLISEKNINFFLNFFLFNFELHLVRNDIVKMNTRDYLNTQTEINVK